MGDPAAEFLGGEALQIAKGQFVEPFVNGLLAEGLIDPQDVGTLVESGSILMRLFLRVLAKGKS